MSQWGFNPDGSYTPAKAAQTVARFKTMMHPPYHIKLHAEEIEGQSDTLMRRLKPMPPEVEAQACSTLSEVLTVFRQHHPTGDWLLALSGVVPGAKKPIGFVDTPIIEKAIKFHTEGGHKGEI